ncbi:polyphosphate kinase 2 [Ahrensia sp. R2A130]|nr:polyphosphate kinase 2 [Ahrensia sp. R2A130]EFL89820.1 polyphosphate kinase 2 [Ahrensia sp. R2A130]
MSALDLNVNGKKRSFDIDDPDLPDWVSDNEFSSGNYPYEKKLKKSLYKEQLEALQLELVKLQAHRLETGKRIMVLFEGRDAAGKGGTIGAFREYLKPRNARVVALSKPTDVEQGQWYYQRYIYHFPTAGNMTMFDRSWYNRGGVEPVMGFCSPQQHQQFLAQTPDFEKLLVDEGYAFFKIWLNVGQEMQIKRFHDRRHNPMKSWKLSPIDLVALTKWDDYTKARDEMLAATHTDHAPWTIIRSNDKRRARLEAIRTVLNAVEYEGKDKSAIGESDDKIAGCGPDFLNEVGA